jgi:rare lipoprotein A (peptidoglycan hydrolase)
VLERPVHAGFAIVAGFSIAASGCSHRVVAKIPAPAKIGASESGMASWYGAPYHGRRTASGEIYDMEQLTAAHRTLPFQTWVEVTDLDNGKKVSVRITDRGPFVDGRIIDLSLAAARKIEMVGPGTARVKLKVIEPPLGSESIATQKTEKPAAARTESPTRPSPPAALDPESPSAAVLPPVPRRDAAENSLRPPSAAQPASQTYAVQAATFADRDRAEAFSVSLRARFGELIEETRVIVAGSGWRVLLGRQMTLGDANALAAKLREAGSEALVVADR